MSANKFSVGDRVWVKHEPRNTVSRTLERFMGDTFGESRIGVIASRKDGYGDYRVDNPSNSFEYMWIAEDSLVPESEAGPRVIKFSDIQKGDRVRFTQKFGEIGSRISEFVVNAVAGSGSVTMVSGGSGLYFYSDDAAKDNCTIELTDRPQPKSAVGDVLTRDDLWRLSAGSVVVNTLTNRAFVVDKEGKRLVGNTITVKFDSARSETIYKIIHIAEEK